MFISAICINLVAQEKYICILMQERCRCISPPWLSLKYWRRFSILRFSWSSACFVNKCFQSHGVIWNMRKNLIPFLSGNYFLPLSIASHSINPVFSTDLASCTTGSVAQLSWKIYECVNRSEDNERCIEVTTWMNSMEEMLQTMMKKLAWLCVDMPVES